MSKRILTIMFACAATALVAGLILSGIWTRGNADTILRPGDPEIVSLGRDVYKINCASCHGANLEGQPNWKQPLPGGFMPAPPHDATGHTWHHADQLLVELTKFGVKKLAGDDYKTKMPAYEGVLSDAEIIAVLSFIKSRWPEAIRARHDLMNKRHSKRQKSN